MLIVTELVVSGTQCTSLPRQLTVPWTLARNWEKMTPDTGSSVTVASFSVGASFNPAFNSCSVNTTYNGTVVSVYNPGNFQTVVLSSESSNGEGHETILCLDYFIWLHFMAYLHSQIPIPISYSAVEMRIWDWLHAEWKVLYITM